MSFISISQAAELTGHGRATVRRRADAAGLASREGVKGARLFDSRDLLPVALGLTGDKLDPGQERAMLDRTRRQVAEVQLAERRRELVPREAVIACWQAALGVCRARLLALPTRLAGECAHLGPTEVQASAKRLVYEALTELASGDGLPPGNARPGPRPAAVEVADPSAPRKASKRTRARTVRG